MKIRRVLQALLGGSVLLVTLLASAAPAPPGPGPNQAPPQTIPIARLATVDGPQLSIAFHPKDMTLEKKVPWQASRHSDPDAPSLEFTSGAAKSLSFELQFDTYEEKISVIDKHFGQLEQLTAVVPQLKRPPMVVVTFGRTTFKGVVADVSARATSFLPDGTPVRMVATITLRRADKAAVASDVPCK